MKRTLQFCDNRMRNGESESITFCGAGFVTAVKTVKYVRKILRRNRCAVIVNGQPKEFAAGQCDCHRFVGCTVFHRVVDENTNQLFQQSGIGNQTDIG